MKTMSLFILSVLFTLSVGQNKAYAHAYLKLPVPRNNSDGLKTAPCGGVARTATPTVFQPGQTITVNWAESINHRSYYVFSFSPTDELGLANATGVASQYFLKAVFDDQNLNNINRGNAATHHQYSTTVTLPTTPCENCTLQMVQVMCDNNQPLDPNNLIDPMNPVFVPTCNNYYSCADIRTAAAGGNPPVPPPPPAPGPGPGAQDLGSTSGEAVKPGFGCGRVDFGGPSGGSSNGPGSSGWMSLLMTLPLLMLLSLRRREQLVKVKRK
jgi:Lytic polysaccharide mono-oxygenase, cellulose-degrading